MRTLFSYNEMTKQGFWRFVVPSRIESACYVLVAFAVLLASNYQSLVDAFWGSGTFRDSIQQSVRQNRMILALDTSHTAATVTLVGFWMVVGAISYSFIWFFQQSIMTVYDDVEHSHDVVPKTVQERYWGSVAAKYVAFFTVMFGMVAFGYITLFVVLPKASRVMLLLLGDTVTFWQVLIFGMVLLVLACLLYVLVLLLRIFHYLLAVTFTQS